MAEIRVRRSYEKEGFKYPVFEYRADWPYISIGFGDEKDYFIENLSLLIASGMGISAALSAIASSVKTRKMKKVVSYIEESVNTGLPIWKAFAATKFFPERVVSLVRAGEEAGRLPEHLTLVTLQLHKEKIFKSRLRSALMYPGIVLFLSFLLLLGGSWYILPSLVAIFDQARGALPFQTRVLLWLGSFLKVWGMIVVPTTIALVTGLLYAVFINKNTKYIGDFVLLRTTGIKSLVQGVELARFGYTFGALLQAGFQISEALQSITDGSNYREYRQLYAHLEESVLKGETFKQALSSYPHSDRYIPIPIQQLLFAAEQSGRLPETLIKIGLIFEEKTEAMSRDLSTILEPVVLIIVGLVVGFVVSAIIGPIYGLSNVIK